MKVGLIDSGLGGLTVLTELIGSCPQHHYIYLGDTRYMPYGNKSLDFLKHRAEELARFMKKEEVQCLYIACNTMSAQAADIFESYFKNRTFNVVQAGVAGTCLLHHHRRGVVIATEATCRSGLYQKELEAHKISAKVIPMYELAQKIEQNVPFSEIEEELRSIRKRTPFEISWLTLGCTHYPLVIETIRKIFPAADIINPAAYLDKEILKKQSSDTFTIEIVTTSESELFKERTRKILGKNEAEFRVEKI